MQTKLTSQGQVSVPAGVRSFLHLIPGSVLVWTQVGDQVIVERAKRHSTREVHILDSPQDNGPAKTLAELMQGIGKVAWGSKTLEIGFKSVYTALF